MRTMCLKYDTEPAHPREEHTVDVEEEDRHLTGAERLKKRRRLAEGRPDNLQPVSRFDVDLRNYERFSEADKDYSNPLKWFLRNKASYPILSQLAMEVHPIPASSSSSERAFSSATRVRQI